MDTSEAGRMGAIITNQKLTTEIRRKAAKKGWRNKKKNETRSTTDSNSHQKENGDTPNTNTKGGDQEDLIISV